MADSSSTMRMLCMLADSGHVHGFGCERKFDYKSGTDRLIFLHANGTVVVFDDAAYNGQSESCPTFLRGKIWQEQPLLQFLCYSVAGVCHRDFDGVMAG